jgi:hypothetical protein
VPKSESMRNYNDSAFFWAGSENLDLTGLHSALIVSSEAEDLPHLKRDRLQKPWQALKEALEEAYGGGIR